MDTEDLKKMAAAEKLHEKARYLRGRFLNFVAVIERDMAMILTEYFCTEDDSKRELFYKKLAEKLSLRQKKEILIDIVRADYPRYWEENKQIFRDLQDIQEFRNKLAHSVLDVSDDALSRPIQEGVAFVQWNKGEPITDREFNNWELRAKKVCSALSDIKRLLPYKESPIA